MSTAIDPILAARAGTMPCQPTRPSAQPGISWSLRGNIVARSARPGILRPWKDTGWKSMIRPVQLINQPIAPVKNGMLTSLIHSEVLTVSAPAI